jgi:hypothetical protein
VWVRSGQETGIRVAGEATLHPGGNGAAAYPPVSDLALRHVLGGARARNVLR